MTDEDGLVTEPWTVCVSRVELNDRTGGGVILRHMLEDEGPLAVVYTQQLFGGDCIGDLAVHAGGRPQVPGSAGTIAVEAIGDRPVDLIICTPQVTADVECAVALVASTGAPLVTYIMDDANLFRDGITDEAFARLVDTSAICLAISPVLCHAYEAKFGAKFWMLPPINDERLFAPPDLAAPENRPPRGVIIGNVWSRDVFDDLRATIRDSGSRVDWYGNAGRPFLDPDPVELARDGIDLHPNLDDDALVAVLRDHDYAIMPSRELDPSAPHDFLYRASLPSRLVVLLTTAHLPIVVLGGEDTTAGQFVTRFGVGAVAPYEPEAAAAAIERVMSEDESRRIRATAARLAPSFASAPVASWIRRSAASGRPVDMRYEDLFDGWPPR